MPYFQTNKYVDEVNTYDTLHDNVCMSNLTGRCYHSPCECMWMYVNLCEWWLSQSSLTQCFGCVFCLPRFFFYPFASGMRLQSLILTLCFDCSTMQELVGKFTGNMGKKGFTWDYSRKSVKSIHWHSKDEDQWKELVAFKASGWCCRKRLAPSGDGPLVVCVCCVCLAKLNQYEFITHGRTPRDHRVAVVRQ